MSTPVFIVGATGRMGRALQEELKSEALARSFALLGLASGREDRELDKISGFSPGTVVIDFSSPSVALKVAEKMQTSKAALLECSTGFTAEEMTSLSKILGKNCWALVPNSSLGVYALGEAAKLIASLLPEDYTISMWESHHSKKKDAPSGTAKQLLLQLRDSRKSGDIAVHSVRGGTEAGHHRIDIHGPYERLSLEHQAQDRKLFAIGALRLAERLSKLPARREAYTSAELWKL